MDLNEIIGLLIFLVSYIIGICIAVITHELAHLLCGRLSGYRFVSFRLLHWLWTKNEPGKIKLTKSAGLSGILGQCLMEPCEDERNFRFLLYNAGGGLFNLIMGVCVLAPLFIAATHDYVMWVLIGMGVPALLSGAANLIPMQAGGIPTDGKNIKEAAKSAAAKHGFYMMLKINADMAKGKRLTDFSENVFAIDAAADSSNYLVANLWVMRAAQLEESGDYKQSYSVLLQPAAEQLPLFYGTQLVLALMFHELVYFGDAASVERARNRIAMKAKDKRFIKLLTMKHPAFMPYHAAKAAFLDQDIAKAKELTEQARKLNAAQQNPGAKHSVTLMLDKLEERIAELEA